MKITMATTQVTPGSKQARVLLLIADDGAMYRVTIGRTLGFRPHNALASLRDKELVSCIRRGGNLWHLTPAGLAEANRIDPMDGGKA